MEQFIQSYNIKFPILLELDKSVASQYEILTIPSTFMIDTEGRIQKNIIGPLDLDALRDNVKQLN